MNNDTWKKVMVMKIKDNRHVGVANTLNQDDRETILATAEFFGASDSDIGQMHFDLGVARYRIFDWLAMGVMSAEVDPRIPTQALKVFVYSFLKVNGDVTAFIQDLRETDYEIDSSWESIHLGEEEK